MKPLAYRYSIITPGRLAAGLHFVADTQEIKASAFFCQSPGCAILLSGYKDWSEWQRWGEDEEDDTTELLDEEEEEVGDAPVKNSPSEPD